jgi:glycosyltransferase involved in cell wall biosynthesis
MSEKVPCSIALLTLNAADSLADCLDGLKDFAEIIVCDGNSTDGTRDIAARYGAKVIQQYDTDEPDVPCAMDKATVRQRAYDASSHAWRFFMDADDTLSREAVEEIRAITSSPNPPHLIWRMPTRIFIDGREILHEATYPSYQTRLVHESVGAHFKGAVHDHLVWDDARFPSGTMKSFYNFHWSHERVAHYWQYLSTYVKRELETAHLYKASFNGFFHWYIYRRLRIILGYILWRLPVMYVRHGFRDSMPLSIELQIVAHHLYIMLGGLFFFIASRRVCVIAWHLCTGEGLQRARRNLALCDWDAYGRVLDLQGNLRESYWKFLRTYRWHRDTFEKDVSNFPDRHFDTVLLLKEPATNALLQQAERVTRKGGVVIGVNPAGAVFRREVH